MTKPEDCFSMTDIRREIDRVDRALVALMAERQGYIGRAAEIKAERGTVRDEARIEDVVAKVIAEAGRVGLDPAIAEPVWRVLIERSIAYEFKAFDKKPASG
ncbi:MAG TPA: chorismate mutase [Rhizomicrobium sp.]|nr:chorismate mutase [Rhizomicrobium sp.]